MILVAHRVVEDYAAPGLTSGLDVPRFLGKVIATGTAEDIRANPEVRTAYLGEEMP